MTQISRPQPEHQNNGYLDSGPYSADQWAELYKILFTSGDAVGQGPFKNVLNALAVTNPSASNIQVDTGWGVCNGHLLKNDAAVAFVPPNPSANPRIDVVVMVENNTAVARTAGIASGNNLVFPTSLTDYNSLSSLPPYTCRLAILRGSEAASPTAPTLDVDTATLFMVPLAQYQISTGGTVSALTDRREYCTFATEVVTAMLADLSVTTAKIADLNVTLGKLAADSVDDTKAGNRVPQFYRRQGGDASDWSTPGTTTRTPGAVRMQGGSVTVPFTSSTAETVAITFPTSFSQPPLVFISMKRPTTGSAEQFLGMINPTVLATGFSVNVYALAGATSDDPILNWYAIGPE